MTLSRRSALLLTAVAAIPRLSWAAGAPLKIGTVGAGNVGKNLGIAWAKAGHPVMFSSRNPDGLKDEVAAAGPNARAGTVAEAIAFADVILMAVPYGSLPAVAMEHGKALATKALLLDASNPILPRDGAIGEEAQKVGAGLFALKLIPGAKIVRAFNAVGAARMSQGGKDAAGKPIGMPIAGDDENALKIAEQLVRETGFEPVRVGNLDFGKYLRPGTPMAGERSPDEVRKVAATLK
jgi:predicted dinucleotide-binding enzyme